VELKLKYSLWEYAAMLWYMASIPSSTTLLIKITKGWHS